MLGVVVGGGTTAALASTEEEDDDVIAVDSENDRFRLITMEQALSSSSSTFRDVVFCAPPSGFQDYANAIEEVATRLWTGGGEKVLGGGHAEEKDEEEEEGGGGGSFIFTSSGAVYEGIDGETVDESSATASDPDSNPRAFRMVRAEDAAVHHGGCALRLAGLYSLERGAHNYWLDATDRAAVVGGGEEEQGGSAGTGGWDRESVALR